MPTLAQKGTFSFDPKAKITTDQKVWLENETAINIIIKVLNAKLSKTGIENRLYFLRGRTGSGKSTMMISSLYEAIIKNSRGKLICSEPRVVLTKANATDVIRYNKTYQFGKQMGVLSGSEKILCTEKECMYYCTPQILNDKLLKMTQLTDEGEIRHNLSQYKIVVVDEVHVLDLPMMSLLKTVRDVVNKYGSIPECPLFIFASATIDTNQMVSYFFPKNSEQIYENPLVIGNVAGSSNHPVNEQFLTDQEIATYNEREKKEGRGSCYTMMAYHFYKNYFKELDKSTSFVKGPDNMQVQCRDVLFFVPLMFGIECIGKILKALISKECPYFQIINGTTYQQVLEWRTQNKGRKRVLFIGFGRGYSPASDELLSKPIETDPDSLKNEIRIIAATPVIETGKTVVTLNLCIDMGLSTQSIYNPLTYDPTNALQYLKQIPTNMNQSIQRLGRVGREAPGNYLHFYSKNIMNKFLPGDIPETINTPCISSLLLNHFKNFEMYKFFDVINENHYLYPTSIDILIRSANDLIQSGYITAYGQVVCLRSSFEYSEGWIQYARFLYYVLGYPLWDALVLASVNWKFFPPLISLSDLNPESLRFKMNNIINDEPTDVVIEGIQRARNVLTSIMYGQDETFTFIKSRIY